MRYALLITVLAGVLLGAGPASAAEVATGADAIKVTREEKLSPRLLELGLSTPALAEETNLRVLLPDGYDPTAARRYPVLYLLNGCCDYDVNGSQAWTTHGETEEATAGLPLIVVMPDGGKGGFYSDWWNYGAGGTPMWETYHIKQLIPWIDQRYRTEAAREGRVIAGLSMGGFGALSYAARHPDLFVAAASFSGAVDSNQSEHVFDALPAQDEPMLAGLWGPRATEEVRWRGHNPWDLAENLRSLQLGLRTGNGQPGPLDEPGSTFDAVESTVHDMTVSMHQRFESLGIGHTYDNYGPGTHKWPYWARSLRASLPEQMQVLANPPAPPARVTYVAAEASYSVFDWSVTFARDTLELTRISNAGADGFTLEGTGTATVTTPPIYRPGAVAKLVLDGAPGSARVAADRRLTITVPTGDDATGTVKISAPLAARCASKKRALTLPRGLRNVRATINGRRLAVPGRRVRITVRGRTKLVVRARTRGGRPYNLIRRYRGCSQRAISRPASTPPDGRSSVVARASADRSPLRARG